MTMIAAQANAGTVVATAPVSVTILAPVTVSATQGLDFGVVTRPANAGVSTVSMDASSHVTVTGSGDAVHGAGAVSSAKFDVAGEAGVTYSTTQALTIDQPGLTNISVTAPATTSGAPGVIPASGVQEIRFGGSFQVSAATPAQAYTGSLQVTVNYN